MDKICYPALDETLYRTRLPNGLTVLVVPKPGFTQKIAYFVTDFGSVHTEFTLDGQRRSAPAGVAHYLEHKLFDMPDRDVSGAFAALGAVVNAFTSYDLTAYYFSCTDHFDDCLKLLLEFVSTPYFPQESVEREQGIIDQEIGMNADDPNIRVFENLMAAMYEHHPIRQPILGTPETIRQITPQVLHDCHRAFYHPENMLLCVLGDVSPEAVAELAQSVLGQPTGARGEKLPLPREEMVCPQPLVSDRMDVAMPSFTLGFKCPPLGKGAEAIRQELIADLACEALFGESSQLYLDMYGAGIIDSSFGGGFETLDGCAMVTCGGDSDCPERVRDAILAQVSVLIGRGIPEADFLRMKRSSVGRRIRELDSFDSTCFRLCAFAMTDFDYFDFPALYDTITPGDICNFLTRTVRQENCCLSIIEPVKEETT